VEGAEDDIAETSVPTRMRKRDRFRGRPHNAGVMVAGDPDVWVRLSRCCTPVPGDEIVGFVTRGHGVSVHRTNCPNVAQLKEQEDRLVEVTWCPTEDSVFLVAIQVEALDRPRLLSDVTRTLSDHHVNILSASVTTSRDRVAISKFTFEMGDPKHLGHVLKAVRGVPGVYDVYRVSGAGSCPGTCAGPRAGTARHRRPRPAGASAPSRPPSLPSRRRAAGHGRAPGGAVRPGARPRLSAVAQPVCAHRPGGGLRRRLRRTPRACARPR